MKKKYQLKSTIKGIALAHENVNHRLYGFRYGWIQELKQCHWNRSSLHLSCLHPPCAGSIYRQVASSSNKMASINTRLNSQSSSFRKEKACLFSDCTSQKVLIGSQWPQWLCLGHVTIPQCFKGYEGLIGQVLATCSPLEEVRRNREGHGNHYGKVKSTRNTWTESMVTERKLRIHLSEKLCILDSGQEMTRTPKLPVNINYSFIFCLMLGMRKVNHNKSNHSNKFILYFKNKSSFQDSKITAMNQVSGNGFFMETHIIFLLQKNKCS